MPNDSWVLEIKEVQTLPSKFNEDRVPSVAKCRPMIVVSRNIRYMRILAGVPLSVWRQMTVELWRQANDLSDLLAYFYNDVVS